MLTTNKMIARKILILHPNLESGGAERQLINLVNGLVSKGEFKVNIGTPFTVGEGYGSKTSREDLEATTNDIMEKVASLLPKNYRGIFPLDS